MREELLDTGFEYRTGDPVLVRVVRREGRTLVTDDAVGAQRAGCARVPEDIARGVEEAFVVNVGRHGNVFLPVVPVGPDAGTVVYRIGEASLALYQELLDLE
jgi:hypothetical protein